VKLEDGAVQMEEMGHWIQWITAHRYVRKDVEYCMFKKKDGRQYLAFRSHLAFTRQQERRVDVPTSHRHFS